MAFSKIRSVFKSAILLGTIISCGLTTDAECAASREVIEEQAGNQNIKFLVNEINEYNNVHALRELGRLWAPESDEELVGIGLHLLRRAMKQGDIESFIYSGDFLMCSQLGYLWFYDGLYYLLYAINEGSIDALQTYCKYFLEDENPALKNYGQMIQAAIESGELNPQTLGQDLLNFASLDEVNQIETQFILLFIQNIIEEIRTGLQHRSFSLVYSWTHFMYECVMGRETADEEYMPLILAMQNIIAANPNMAEVLQYLASGSEETNEAGETLQPRLPNAVRHLLENEWPLPNVDDLPGTLFLNEPSESDVPEGLNGEDEFSGLQLDCFV